MKLIACEVFVRSACLAIAHSPHTVDPTFTPKAEHEQADRLRATVQNHIDAASETGVYDRILIALGLCGNGLVGIQARDVALVVPRAHDCCTLFLGSRESFLREFGDSLSASWSCVGYMERGDEYLRDSETGKTLGLEREYADLVAEYGEENADYVWQTLHPVSRQDEVIFITDPEIPDGRFRELAEREARENGLGFRPVTGNSRLIRNLIHGIWNEDEFLIVPPGGTIQGVYDHDRVVTVESSGSR